ncbi:hypothetical protein [Enterococcus phage PEF1]
MVKMEKIFKTKSYRVTYTNSNGVDHFSGRYILENLWLLNMVKQGTAKIKKI